MMPDSALEDEMMKADYWLNELRSLGISARKKNELNDKKELHNLADKIKEQFYLEYKTAYA